MSDWFVVLVSGDRNWIDEQFIHDLLGLYKAEYGHRLVIVQGGAKGVDTIAKEWAEKNRVDVITRWAHWDHYGKPAGPIRNHVMHDEHKPHLVIAIHPNMFGGSIGTYEMYRYAKRNGTNVRYFTGKENLCALSLP